MRSVTSVVLAHRHALAKLAVQPRPVPAPGRSRWIAQSASVASESSTSTSKACSDAKVVAFSAMRYVKDFLGEPLTANFPNSVFTEARLDVETAQLADGADAVVVFVNDVATRAVVQRLAAGGVRLIACRSAGYDRVDLEACREFGIRVVRVPVYSPQSIAEHAVALMFCLNRKLHLAHRRVSQGNYTLSGLVGFEVTGKTVGVIGTGAIGAHACRIFKGIGMNVLAHDLRPRQDLIDMGVQYMSVEDMMPHCHVISLHCPLLPSTRHIVDASHIAMMREGVLIVNVSRGGLIDSDALIDGLESGRIGGVGMDVYENEGGLFFQDFTMYDVKTRMHFWDRRFKTLLSYPQVLVTPHSAFLTHEALSNIATTTIQNLTEFATGAELTNEVKAS